MVGRALGKSFHLKAELYKNLKINEGFAEWGGAFGLQYVDSSVAWENYLFQYDSDWAYWVDQTRNSRPVVNKQNNDGFVVDTCEAIDAQFDGIAYSKGSMLIRMIIDVIGLDAFQAKFEL
jgi:aminopeptidase N